MFQSRTLPYRTVLRKISENSPCPLSVVDPTNKPREVQKNVSFIINVVLKPDNNAFQLHPKQDYYKEINDRDD